MMPFKIEYIIHYKNEKYNEDYWTANLVAKYVDDEGVTHDNLMTSPHMYTNMDRYQIDFKTLKEILKELGFGTITKSKLKCKFYTRNNGVHTYYCIRR